MPTIRIGTLERDREVVVSLPDGIQGMVGVTHWEGEIEEHVDLFPDGTAIVTRYKKDAEIRNGRRVPAQTIKYSQGENFVTDSFNMGQVVTIHFSEQPEGQE